MNDQSFPGSDGQRRRRQSSEILPEVYNFVMVAVAADQEEAAQVGGGAVRLEAVAGMVTLLLLITLGLKF